MGNYLYNGVELPALPEWDKTTYPYVVIFYALELVFYSVKPTTSTLSAGGSTYYGTYNVGTVKRYQYDEEANAWVFYDAEKTFFRSLLSGVTWANHDVYQTDGALYLAATAPIPVSTATTWKYNGVELPGLPDIDWTTYPYAVIAYLADNQSYRLYFCADRCTVTDTTAFYKAPYIWYASAGDSWEYKGEVTTTSQIIRSMVDPIWANHNILNTDGTTYLALSSPEPVVPTVPTTPLEFHLKSFLMGVVDELAGRPSIV